MFKVIDALEKIQGKSRLDVFKQLKEEKKPIKIKMQRLDYEALTTITDVKTKGKNHFIIIRPPNDITDIADDFEKRSLHFEFNSENGIQFSFMCPNGKIQDNDLWVPFPEFIEQIQRRRDFRLTSPVRTTLDFEVDVVKYNMNLIDLSMGGACVEIPEIKNGTEMLRVVKPGDKLLGVNIVSFSQGDKLGVRIRKASIIRVDEPKNHKGYRLGVQFTDIEREEVNKLKKMIYDLQRYFLQRRLKPNI